MKQVENKKICENFNGKLFRRSGWCTFSTGLFDRHVSVVYFNTYHLLQLRIKGILYNIINLGWRIQIKYLDLVFKKVSNVTYDALHMPHYFIIKIFINAMIKVCAIFMYIFNKLVPLKSLLASSHLSRETSTGNSS